MAANSLLIGGPVWKRNWILPTWFEHVEAAAERAEVTPSYLFITDKSLDPHSVAVIEDEAFRRDRDFEVIHFPQGDRPDRRDWPVKGRKETMVALRNLLLARVREIGPDFFLSLDSDILLHPDAISSLMQDAARFDAIGGKCFMTVTGTNYPSCARVNEHGLLHEREDAEGSAFPMQVIMAIKLMRSTAYNIDYVYHPKGEDVGWSLECEKAGLKLGWDCKVCSKHVMGEQWFGKFDDRCGF